MKGQMPWFPFWVRDFLTSRKVAFLNMEEVGIYVLLLCHEWEDGPLPNDSEFLGRLIRADPDVVQAVLEHCFRFDVDVFVNDRLEQTRNEQNERYEKRAKAGRASGRARRKSKSGNDDERRSNNVQTNPEHTDTETEEKKTDTSKPDGPVIDLWDVFLEELGGSGKQPRLTDKRKQKLRALYDEQLKSEDQPTEAFRRILRAVKKSGHHMGNRSYQMPESLFRDESRRDGWMQKSLQNGSTNGDQWVMLNGRMVSVR